MFEAPRFISSMSEPPATRLLAFLGSFRPQANAIFQKAATQDGKRAHERLEAYWAARNVFIWGGQNMRPSNNVEEIYRETKDLLFSNIRTSPDFEAAYYPLLAMAERLRAVNSIASMEILAELESTAPECPDAREMRMRYFSSGR
jgi:spermidine synthase